MKEDFGLSFGFDGKRLHLDPDTPPEKAVEYLSLIAQKRQLTPKEAEMLFKSLLEKTDPSLPFKERHELALHQVQVARLGPEARAEAEAIRALDDVDLLNLGKAKIATSELIEAADVIGEHKTKVQQVLTDLIAVLQETITHLQLLESNL